MASSEDLYEGDALFKLGGRAFDVHVEITAGAAAGEDPGGGSWHGCFGLSEAEEAAEFAEAVAWAKAGGHDVDLQLPAGQQARIELDGERFAGREAWPLGAATDS